MERYLSTQRSKGDNRMKKIFRLYREIKAENKDEAMEKLNATVMEAIRNESTASNYFRCQENPLTNEELTIVLEAARVGLSDAESYEHIADKLDLSDKELKSLQGKIESVTNR
jgi:hypothetical protein